MMSGDKKRDLMVLDLVNSSRDEDCGTDDGESNHESGCHDNCCRTPPPSPSNRNGSDTTCQDLQYYNHGNPSERAENKGKETTRNTFNILQQFLTTMPIAI